MPVMTAETIGRALGGRKAGGGWMARCPTHDNRTSLAIRDPHDEKVLIRCHAACQPDAAETTGEAYTVVGIGCVAEIVGEIVGPTVKRQHRRHDLIDPAIRACWCCRCPSAEGFRSGAGALRAIAATQPDTERPGTTAQSLQPEEFPHGH
jgi:hypothetical protein